MSFIMESSLLSRPVSIWWTSKRRSADYSWPLRGTSFGMMFVSDLTRLQGPLHPRRRDRPQFRPLGIADNQLPDPTRWRGPPGTPRGPCPLARTSARRPWLSSSSQSFQRVYGSSTRSKSNLWGRFRSRPLHWTRKAPGKLLSSCCLESIPQMIQDSYF